MRAMAAGALVLACAIAAAPASADPYFTEVAIGGLTLTKTDAISMDSEDLYISRDIVRGKFRFTNSTDKPIDALVAFPLPDIPAEQCGVDENIMFWSDPSELEFDTKLDGRPLALHVVEQAIFKGEDVSARLTALHIPLNPRGGLAIDSLPDADRSRLAADGLIHLRESKYSACWEAAWTLRTTVTGHQTYPPRKTIIVEHEYAPRTGAFPLELLDQENAFSELRREYCIDDGWLQRFIKGAENKKLEKETIAGGTTLGYALNTGGNWKGPIGDFRLVVEGKPDSLVSFCADGVKQISPTQYEVRYTNFTPKKDLNILFIP